MNTTRRAFLAATTAGVATTALAAAPKRPNIVCIMADDLGFSDIGCYGSEIQTPNLDRLAANGLRFTQFYNAARCCPSRACLLTGLYNHQTGVGDMVNHRDNAAYQGYLNDHCVTVAEVLRDAGYRTAMAGKWHVGEERPHWPVDRGFEQHFGLISGASSYWAVDEGRHFAFNGQEWRPEAGFYATDAYTDHAVSYIDDFAKSDQFAKGTAPYFLYLAYTAPHWPLHARAEDIALYRGKYMKGWDKLRQERHSRQISMGVVKQAWPLTPRDGQVPAWDSLSTAEQDAMDLRMSVYAAQIHRMDFGIGRVLEAIQRSGQEENTLVLFLADNGGCHEENIGGEKAGVPPGPPGSYTSYGRPWANLSNTPFRLFKHWVHEGGISSPFIARWPAVIKAKNALHHEAAHITDLMATFADMAGAKYPASRNGQPITPTEGMSLAPTFHGLKRRPHEVICWEHEGHKAVRHGNWKLVSRFEKRTWELYDLAADRSEMRDLAAVKPQLAATMRKSYNAWATRCGVVPFEVLPKPTGRA